MIIVGGGLAIVLIVLLVLIRTEAGAWVGIILGLPVALVVVWIVLWAAGNAAFSESNIVPHPVVTISGWLTGDG